MDPQGTSQANGERAVVIGGDASGSTIITGDTYYYGSPDNRATIRAILKAKAQSPPRQPPITRQGSHGKLILNCHQSQERAQEVPK